MLRKNSRMSLTDISKATQIPVSTVYERLRQYYGKVIKKYTVLLDFVQLGYSTHVTFFLKVKNKHKQRLLMHIQTQHNVNNAYCINNGFDLCCDAVFRNLHESEAFAKHLEEEYNISRIQSYYILAEVKREGFYLQPAVGWL